jgi:hypothetical protein
VDLSKRGIKAAEGRSTPRPAVGCGAQLNATVSLRVRGFGLGATGFLSAFFRSRTARHDAAFFQPGDLLQEGVGLTGRPCLRMENRPCTQQGPRQAALLGGTLDRGQQACQNRAVPRASIFLKRPAQWQMLRFSLIGNPMGVRGQERERMIRIALVSAR